jgi:hypothetical protein
MVGKTVAFLDVLASDGPSPELAGAPDLYGWLIGSWEADVIDYEEDGSRRLSRGEWHFAWVLEGRAVQDVWIAPPRAARGGLLDRKGNRYGTSLRVYDPKADTWRVTWINPVSQAHNHLIGRREGDDIVQEGQLGDGTLIRWSFREITSDSFRWCGEASADGGGTWLLEAEFLARRAG